MSVGDVGQLFRFVCRLLSCENLTSQRWETKGVLIVVFWTSEHEDASGPEDSDRTALLVRGVAMTFVNRNC